MPIQDELLVPLSEGLISAKLEGSLGVLCASTKIFYVLNYGDDCLS